MTIRVLKRVAELESNETGYDNYASQSHNPGRDRQGHYSLIEYKGSKHKK
jgi:hypothetical protein